MAKRERGKKSLSIWGFIGNFILFMFIPVAQAQTPFDITYCSSVTFTPVYASKELTVSGSTGTSIIFSNHENKIFDNLTMHFVGVSKTVGNERTALNYVKLMDPDGDIIVGEISVEEPVKTLKFLHGTGKWKGIKGEGKGPGITKGKPILPGTSQGCSGIKGTFELPK
jgi:hypothetical protein